MGPWVEIYRRKWRRVLRSHRDAYNQAARNRSKQNRHVGSTQDWTLGSRVAARHDGHANYDGYRIQSPVNVCLLAIYQKVKYLHFKFDYTFVCGDTVGLIW